MIEPLSTHRAPDLETLWTAMRFLVDRLFDALDGGAVLDDSLDILVDILGADRGAILMQRQGGAMQIINARGRKKELSPAERDEVSRTIVRQARDERRCIIWDLDSLPTTSESVSTFGILAAFAAPLHRGPSGREGPRGVLYVDFRDHRKFAGPRHVEFFMSAATLVGTVIEQGERDRTAREHLVEARSNLLEARRDPPLSDLLGTQALGAVEREVRAALHGDAPILVTGESGTGKTLLVHAMAEAIGRRPIVRAMLGASDDLNTITSELFGHERGAYSGATSKRTGLVEFADGGTLIFDEVLNFSPTAQRLLLDFTQFGTYRSLGYERAEPKRANVRLLCATNGDLRAAIREGRFREDLYHRLAGVHIELPPLRERRDDIPLLAEVALRTVDPGRTWALSSGFRRLLLSPSIPWRGNVRQLERVISRARDRAISRDAEATTLLPEHVEARDLDAEGGVTVDRAEAPAPPGSRWQQMQAERSVLDEREAVILRETLVRHGGVIAHAARELGIARTTLSDRIEALGVRGPRRS